MLSLGHSSGHVFMGLHWSAFLVVVWHLAVQVPSNVTILVCRHVAAWRSCGGRHGHGG
jgi:hypothetical protein